MAVHNHKQKPQLTEDLAYVTLTFKMFNMCERTIYTGLQPYQTLLVPGLK